MARRTNKEKKSSEKWFEKDFLTDLIKENNVELVGKVTKIFFENEKVVKFGCECVNKTSKGNFARCWVTVTFFGDDEIKENDILFIKGYLQSNEYKGTWSLDIVANDIDFLED